MYFKWLPWHMTLAWPTASPSAPLGQSLLGFNDDLGRMWVIFNHSAMVDNCQLLAVGLRLRSTASTCLHTDHSVYFCSWCVCCYSVSYMTTLTIHPHSQGYPHSRSCPHSPGNLLFFISDMYVYLCEYVFYMETLQAHCCVNILPCIHFTISFHSHALLR